MRGISPMIKVQSNVRTTEMRKRNTTTSVNDHHPNIDDIKEIVRDMLQCHYCDIALQTKASKPDKTLKLITDEGPTT